MMQQLCCCCSFEVLLAALLDGLGCLCRLAALWSVCLQSGTRRGDDSHRVYSSVMGFAPLSPNV